MKKYYFLIFFVLLLMIAGCKTDQDTDKKGTFLGGSEGVTVEFVNLAPPSQFNQDEDVRLRVLLKNKGEARVATGYTKVRIFGVQVSDFGLTSAYKSNLGPLEAAGEFTKEGGEQEIDFGTIRYKPEIINQADFTLRTRLCYPYQTKVLTDVCIKSLIGEEADEGVCDLAGEKLASGDVSSAPIQVTSLTQQTRGSDQVRIDIVIENKGPGDVFLIDETCENLDNDVKRLNAKNKVKVKVNSPVDVKCSFRTGEPSNQGVVVLDDNTKKETLSCWKDVEETIVDKLSLELSYLYRDQAIKEVTIFQGRS